MQHNYAMKPLSIFNTHMVVIVSVGVLAFSRLQNSKPKNNKVHPVFPENQKKATCFKGITFQLVWLLFWSYDKSNKYSGEVSDLF